MKPWFVAALVAPVAAISLATYVVAVTPSPVPTSGNSAQIPPEVTAAATTGSASVPTPATQKTPVSLFDDPTQGQQQANVFVRIMVPITDIKSVLDATAVHPYPMKPPVVKAPLAPVPEDEKSIKTLMLSSCYNARETADKIYPIGGLRWQVVYRNTVRKANIGVPHTIFSAYQWIDRVMPIAMAEAKRVNQIETERQARYQKAVEEFEKTREDYESQAVSNGLSPIAFRSRKDSTARGTIPAGNWWLTCTRKAPGVTYYWQVPITAAPGENVNVTLTQANALIISGGW